MSYTKGEWKISNKSFGNSDVGGNLVIRSEGGIVAMACTINEGLVNAEANAHLIAAAPDLYEALESWDKLRAMHPLDSGDDIDHIFHECCEITDKALAKAEGK